MCPDKVAVLKHGRIVEHGTYRELRARGVTFRDELQDAVSAKPTMPSAPHMLEGTSAAPAGGPIQAAMRDDTVSNGHASPSPSPAKLGQGPLSAGPTTPTPTSDLQKGELIKVPSGCWVLCSWFTRPAVSKDLVADYKMRL